MQRWEEKTSHTSLCDTNLCDSGSLISFAKALRAQRESMEAYEWTHFFTHSRGRHRYDYKFRHLEAIVPIVNVIVLFTIRIRKMLESTCYTEEPSPRLMTAVSPIENFHMTIESKAILLHK